MATKISVIQPKDLGVGIKKNDTTKKFDVNIEPFAGEGLNFADGKLNVDPNILTSGSEPYSLKVNQTPGIDHLEFDLAGFDVNVSNGIAHIAALNKGNGSAYDFDPTYFDVSDKDASGEEKFVTLKSAENSYDLHVALSTTADRINENEETKVIVTVTNVGESISEPADFKMTWGSLQHNKVQFAKDAEISVKSDAAFSVKALKSMQSATLTYSVVPTSTGSLSISAELDGSDNNAKNNRAVVTILASTTRDTGYRSQNCPALVIKDVETDKVLKNANFNTSVSGVGDWQIENPNVYGSVNRLNIYDPKTKEIKLFVSGATTASLRGYSTKFYNLQTIAAEFPDSADFTAVPTFVDSNRSSTTSVNGKRYLMKPTWADLTYRKSASGGAQGFGNGNNLRFGIHTDKITAKPEMTVGYGKLQNFDWSFKDEVLTLSNVEPGSYFFVSFRPRGENCEWQTVLLGIPMEIYNNADVNVELISGPSQFVKNTAEVPSETLYGNDWLNVNWNEFGSENSIVSATTKATPLPVISGAGTYRFKVSGASLDQRAHWSGNVSIKPDGEFLDVVVSPDATSQDNAIYLNGDIKLKFEF